MYDRHAHSFSCSPRYLEGNSTSPSFSISHKRSGTLKIHSSQAMIAQTRSNALLQSVTEGDISLDAILAFPIDWQGIASELQWTRSRMATIDEEDESDMVTMNPLAIKTRARSAESKQNRHQKWASLSSASQEVVAPSPSSSSLGLQFEAVNTPLLSNFEHNYTSSFDEVGDTDTDCPMTPELYAHSFSSSPSSSTSSFHDESPVSTPPASLYDGLYAIEEEEDATFELKSYCSAFNESTSSAACNAGDEGASSLASLPAPLLCT